MSNYIFGSQGFVNGAVQNVSQLYNSDKNNFGPRLGFAYDVFEDGKTAIRGGIAILYNPRFSVWSPTTENPPAILSPVAYYGTINTLLQTSGQLAPTFNVARLSDVIGDVTSHTARLVL